MFPSQKKPAARVFVGVPTINRPELVREAVESLLRQSFSAIRVIVSDNCSEPSAADQVGAFIESLRDSRVSFHQQPENVGEYGQGRFFFEQAREHEYFVILHDDDVLEPEYLEAALRALEASPGAAFFVANPYLLDGEGQVSKSETVQYLAEHGRNGQPGGEIDVLSTHMEHGFTPISGTVFRTRALVQSGFVDDDCHGNFPFELNVFLRLGEMGAKAWFDPRTLLGFRFHRESLRNYLRLMDNPAVVGTMLQLFARRRFEGRNERRRQVILSRLHRAMALIVLRNKDAAAARDHIRRALGANPRSVKAWLLAPLVLAAPGMLRRALPRVPELRQAPRFSEGE